MSSTQVVRDILAAGEALAIDDFAVLGLSRATLFRALQRLVASGEVQRVQHGRYQLAAVSDRADPWVIATRAVPEGVLCLLSALAFHELGTQMPADVWLALPKSAYRPSIKYPPVQYVHFSGSSYTEGQEVHHRDGGVVRVYSVAKTVSDCFKFRNRLGLDVAIEALQAAHKERRATIQDIMAMSRICRVQTVIRPYLEAIVNSE